MKKALFALVMFSFLLTACREKVDLHFNADQHWRATLSLTVDQAIADMLLQFGGIALADEFNLPELPSSALESDNWINMALDLMVREWRNQGLEARWGQLGNTYDIQLKGQGYDQLPAVFYQAITLTRINDSPETYQLIGSFGVPNDELAILTMGLLDHESIVTVHAERILDCNGCEINGGTATGCDPGYFYTGEPGHILAIPAHCAGFGSRYRACYFCCFPLLWPALSRVRKTRPQGPGNLPELWGLSDFV